MKKANDLTRSAAILLAALALAGCASTTQPEHAAEDTPPVATETALKPAALLLKKGPALETEEPAGEEAAQASEAQTGRGKEASTEVDAAEPDGDEPGQAAAQEQTTAPDAGQTRPSADDMPQPTAAETVPEPVTDPMPEPEPASASAPAYGAIPFNLAEGTGKWWSIDSTDSAYWAMQEQINAVRAAGGLPALAMDSGLSAIASTRCESFVAGGPFDHSGMVTLSEICASGPLGSASAACAAWVASPDHYANIMRTDISSMGVGCWFCDYEGNQYTYWTVTFG